MKNFKIKTILLCITLLIAISCSNDDALSPLNQTRIEDKDAFATPERVQQQILGIYAGVKTGNFMGGRYYVYQDIRGEEFNNERTNLVTNLSTWNFLLGSSTGEVQNLWGAAYLAINRCNIAISRLNNSPVSPVLKAQYTAEAKFLRALSYFSLVTLYARPYWDGNGSNPGVPLRLTPITSPGQSDLARATVNEVYVQIIQDLNDAEAGLPLTYATPYDRTTRAHRNTAIALKTRVFLSQRDYLKVVTEANKIVSLNSPFSALSGVANALVPSVASAFTVTATTPENILSYAFTAQDAPGTQNSLPSYWSRLNGNTGEYSLLPTSIISNTGWKNTDARRAFTAVVSGKTYLQTKWSGGAAAVEYMQAIRYAEVLLNLSEGLARSTNSVDARAVALLNAIRQRSDVTTTFTVSSFATTQDLFDQIAIERRIEFLGEGFRSLDLMRLGQTFPTKSIVGAVAATNNEYIWPIPQNELLYNKLATQNSGY